MATRATLSSIKRLIEDSIDQPVSLRTHKGRKKYYTKQGKIVETYPDVFVVNIDHGKLPERKETYTYSDVLTSTVEITFDETKKGLLADKGIINETF